MPLSTIDLLPPDQRDAILVGALRDQLDFMRSEVPFWRTRLAEASGSKISELRDLAGFPILTKEELRSLSPGTLLPRESHGKLEICRWTSGTSGRPTFSGWTKSDWSALVASTAQMLARQAPAPRPVAFNCYSQSHLTGGLSIMPRFSASEARFSTGATTRRSSFPRSRR
jgi:phenylacetate-CoA ligase